MYTLYDVNTQLLDESRSPSNTEIKNYRCISPLQQYSKQLNTSVLNFINA